MAEEGWIQRLQTAVKGKRVEPPVPEGRQVYVGAKDADEGPVATETDESASTSCWIEYTDSKGDESARVITFRRIEGHFGRPEIVRAFCHLRRKTQTFRLDGMRTMACAVSGEELDPIEHCIALHRDGALKIEDKALTRVMRIVMFMARCDGEFHRLEHGAIEDILGRYFRFFGGDDAAYECASREAIRLAPSGDDVVKAVRWLRGAPLAPELAKFAIQASGAVIDADGVHRQAELEWAIELGDGLKKIATRG